MNAKTSNLPQRKHPRLKDYAYNENGSYYVTICTANRKCLLSCVVGRGLAPAAIELSAYGKIAKEQLLLLEKRFVGVKIAAYVIMPNHIHAIITLSDMAAGASPRPTLTDVVCVFKSLTTAECKKVKNADKIFQTSFYEHVIRSDTDYAEIYDYIKYNPDRWHEDKLYPRNA